jgi:hypothetical protein
MKNYGWFYILVIVFITGVIILVQHQKIITQDNKIKLLQATQCTPETNEKYYKGYIELATETATKRLIKQLQVFPTDKAGKVALKELINSLTVVNQESNKWAK